jgi:hypothetical protein
MGLMAEYRVPPGGKLSALNVSGNWLPGRNRTPKK